MQHRPARRHQLRAVEPLGAQGHKCPQLLFLHLSGHLAQGQDVFASLSFLAALVGLLWSSSLPVCSEGIGACLLTALFLATLLPIRPLLGNVVGVRRGQSFDLHNTVICVYCQKVL